MALTEQEVARLNELQEIADKTDEDNSEIQELLKKRDLGDDMEDFDSAWEDDEQGAPKEKDEEEEEEVEDNENGSQQDKDALFKPTPAEENTDSGNEGEQTSQKLQELTDQLAKQDQKMKSWEGRISAANKRADEAEAKLKEKESTDKAKTDDVSLTEEDDEILSEFINEFPSLEKPIKVLVGKLVGKAVGKRIEKVEEDVTSVKKTAETIAETSEADAQAAHQATITDAHSDWEEIFNTGKLSKWIEAQPGFLQDGLNRVVKNGSAKEIIEMFDSYKESNGLKSKPSTTKKSKADKLKDMSAVRSSSGGPPKDKKKVDKEDYDGAWDEASSTK